MVTTSRSPGAGDRDPVGTGPPRGEDERVARAGLAGGGHPRAAARRGPRMKAAFVETVTATPLRARRGNAPGRRRLADASRRAADGGPSWRDLADDLATTCVTTCAGAIDDHWLRRRLDHADDGLLHVGEGRDRADVARGVDGDGLDREGAGDADAGGVGRARRGGIGPVRRVADVLAAQVDRLRERDLAGGQAGGRDGRRGRVPRLAVTAVAGEVVPAGAGAVVGVGRRRHGQHGGGAEDRDGHVAPDDGGTARCCEHAGPPESCMGPPLPPGAARALESRPGRVRQAACVRKRVPCAIAVRELAPRRTGSAGRFAGAPASPLRSRRRSAGGRG